MSDTRERPEVVRRILVGQPEGDVLTDPYAAGDPTPYRSAPADYGPLPPSVPQNPPHPPARPGTDGLAIAALVTGVLFTGPVALVLGVLGLRRVNRTGREGKGMAIAGIVLGAVETAFGIVMLLVVGIGVLSVIDDLDQGYGDDPALDVLWDACEQGDMAACDQLYMDSHFGTEYETFGDTCGGRTSGGTDCWAPED